MIASNPPSVAAQWSGVYLPGRRRDSAAHPPMPKRKGSPEEVVPGVDVGFGGDQLSEDSAIAAERRPVQCGIAIAVHGKRSRKLRLRARRRR